VKLSSISETHYSTFVVETFVTQLLMETRFHFFWPFLLTGLHSNLPCYPRLLKLWDSSQPTTASIPAHSAVYGRIRTQFQPRALPNESKEQQLVIGRCVSRGSPLSWAARRQRAVKITGNGKKFKKCIS
jgi:hypothetical protein